MTESTLTIDPEPRIENRAGKVHKQLRELIVRGSLAPGTRIIEADVAARLGVSRTPVRTALHRLQQEGYIVAADSGRRARLAVAPLTREDGTEIFNIVAEIEGLAGRYAAQLNPEPRGRLAAELRALNSDLKRAAETDRPDPTRFFELDRSFHRRYVEGAGRRRLLAIHNSIKPQADRYNRVYTRVLVDTILTSAAEHDQIVDSIERGDAEGAQHAVQTNWRNAARRLSRIMDSEGERGSW